MLDVWDGSRLPQEHEDLAVQKVEQLKSAIFEEAKLTFSNVYVPASFSKLVCYPMYSYILGSISVMFFIFGLMYSFITDQTSPNYSVQLPTSTSSTARLTDNEGGEEQAAQRSHHPSIMIELYWAC